MGVIDKVEISASLLKVSALVLAASNRIMYFIFPVAEIALGVHVFSKLLFRTSPKGLGP